MEIPQQIVKEAFELKNKKSFNKILRKELKKLQVFSIEEILFEEKENKIDSNVRKTHNHVFSCSNESKILELRKVINTLNEFLIDGIEKNNSKSILIFIYANCYFMINPKCFLNQDEIQNLSKRKISKTIFDLLSSVNFTTSQKNGIPRNEIKLITNYSSGISENNLMKVYDFVNALERGGRGFHINYLLERVCWFIYYLNFKYYLKLINNLSKPEEFVFFFQSLNEKELIKITNTKSISNNWANIELIRQIVEKEDKSVAIGVKSSKAIYNRLIEINKNDFEFLKQTISYFENSVLFNSALGKFLTNISLKELEEIVDTTQLINKYESKNKEKYCLLDYYAKNSTDIQLNQFLELIFVKWESFLETLFNDDNFYSNNLVLTDYCEYIVEYFVSLKTDSEIIKFINIQIEKINNINCNWFKNHGNQISHFYLYLSKLYLLSYSYKTKKLKNSNIILNYERIKNDDIMLCRFDRDNNLKNYLNIISENLS